MINLFSERLERIVDILIQNDVKRKEQGIVKEYYYYMRDGHGHPRITVCLIRDDMNRYHRGIALCSFDEKQIDKKAGKRRAKARAMTALHTRQTSMPISRDEACGIVFSTALWQCMEGDGWYKSEFNVEPHDIIEKHMTQFNCSLYSVSKRGGLTGGSQ